MLHVKDALAKKAVAFSGTRWPQTTANLAFRLFCRTGRPGGASETAGMPDAAEPDMILTPGGQVAAWSLPAANPVGKSALIIHGWNSRSRHMLPVARALNAAGIDVVMLDLPGHGASSGRALHLGKAIDAVDAVWRNYGPFTSIIGHSLGGVVGLNAAIGAAICVPARQPESLVMIASPNSMPALFRWFGRRIGLPQPAQDAFEYRVLRILGRPLDMLVAADQLQELDIPVLIAHDMDDTDVLYADALRMARAGDHVRLHTTSGLGHRRILKDAGLHAALRAHVLGEDAAVGSGSGGEIRDCA